MARFKVKQAVSGTVATSLHGSIDFRFDAGEVVPRSPEQRAALDSLVGAELAELLEEDPERDPSEPIETPSLESMTRAELIATASARGLDTTGTKAELVARIEAADEEGTA